MQPDMIDPTNTRSRLSLRLKVLKEELEECRKRRQATRDAVESIQSEMKALLEEERPHLGQMIEENRSELKDTRSKLMLIRKQLSQRMKDMIMKLFEIYPITEFPDGKGYSICDIYLPKLDNFEKHDETMVSVAIGYVCHLLLLISDILDVPLRSPVQHCGSKSVIYCDRQAFPLFTGSSKNRDFFYGVTLLNLNIVQLRESLGIGPAKDQDETLANLHGIYRHIKGGGGVIL